jgi:hypothetical protein
MADKIHMRWERNREKVALMLNHHSNPDTVAAAKSSQRLLLSPPAGGLDLRLSPGQILAPLSHVIGSLQSRAHQGGTQVIIRFKNGYGAIISAYRLLEGIYEVAPLRFYGPGPEDYELYFRSHVPDLTWCSESDEMVGVCEEISRLLPPGQV